MLLKYSISILTILFFSVLAPTSAQQKQQDACVSEAETQRLFTIAQEKWQRLEVRQQLSQLQTSAPTASHVLFRWPLRVSGDYDWIPNYYMIQNYVDLDATSSTQDYNCGARTYNGHNGIDINIWPFWWNMMQQQYVYAVAAAPGLVTSVTDNMGNDQNCSCTGSNNGIVILHSDGSTSRYLHIKDNSALVENDQYVQEGQLLANIGSSGCSSNPHLHFEVRDSNNVRLEPFQGSCNSTTNDSWWQNQKPYWEPQINRIMTHGSNPSLQGYNGNSNFCTGGESVNAKTQFNPSDLIFFGVAFHDILANTSATFTIYYPNGNQWISSNYAQGNSTWSRFYHVFANILPANAPTGTYTFRAAYNGQNYYHYFTVGCTANYTINNVTISGNDGYIASSGIQTNATLGNGSKVLLQAGNSITFNPNFIAAAGSVLKARIKPCNYSE